MKAAVTLLLALTTLLPILGLTRAQAATTPRPPPHQISGTHGHACSYTNPEYSINAGGASLTVRAGSQNFYAQHTGYAMQGPYTTIGYYNSKNSASTRKYGGCNGAYALNGQQTSSPVMPVRIGRQGHITSSLSDTTSRNYRGDTGWDIWFNNDKHADTYRKMANGGTEIMLWTSSVGLPEPNSYNVHISGHWWGVTEGLAANGHGRNAKHPKGWNVINFILNNHRNGTVMLHNLYLNPFISYVIRHNWLNPHAWLLAIDQGGEIWRGALNSHSVIVGIK